MLLTFAGRFLKGGHDVIPELRDQSGSTRTRKRQAADECRRDIDSSERQCHGVQARLADNGWAQDGLTSHGRLHGRESSAGAGGVAAESGRCSLLTNVTECAYQSRDSREPVSSAR